MKKIAQPKTLDISGVDVREKTRRDIAIKLLYIWGILETLIIVVGGILLWEGKFSAENFLNGILVISSIFSGLLGAAITFYYSAKD